MKILLIGTPTCIKCKEASAKLDSYCKEHNIKYTYMYLDNAPKNIVDDILSHNIKQAPVLILDNRECRELSSGDEALSKIDSLIKNS